MPKRARRPATRRQDDIVTPERRAHGPVERLEKQIAASAGAIGRPFKAVDTLAVMEKRGTITAGMRQAGEDFRAEFRKAALDPLRAANLLRCATGTSGDGPSVRAVLARERIWKAICAVGGLASPAGACLWHVLGFERSLKEWALELGWSGRRVSQETASGILVASLGALEAHYSGTGTRLS